MKLIIINKNEAATESTPRWQRRWWNCGQGVPQGIRGGPCERTSQILGQKPDGK